MSFLSLFLLFSGAWVFSSQDIAIKNKVKSLSSYESYLVFKREKKEFEKDQTINLKLRQQNLKLEKKRKTAKNHAYLLDFLAHVQSPDIKSPSRFSQSKKLSDPEKAFLAYQKKQQAFKEQRKRAFSAYKKNHKQYQKNQNRILSSRLKAVSALRDKKEDSKIPIF